MKKKVLTLSFIVAVTAVTFHNNCFNLIDKESTLSLLDINALAQNESLGPDGMELVSYICDDGIHYEETCEISSGTTEIECTYGEETFCPPEPGTGSGNNDQDEKHQCPKGGSHTWKFISGKMICTKCYMTRVVSPS